MLAAEVPADVHELDGVERAAAAPGHHGAVRGRSLERVFDGHEAGAVDVAPRRAEARADVGEQHGVDAVEPAVTDEPRLGGEQLLGDTGPHDDRARQPLALHDLFHRERGDDVDRLTGVVTFAVAGRAVDQRLAIGDARHLRRLRNAVDVRAERDDGLTATPRRPPRGRHAGNAGLDREAVALEQVRQITLSLELLKRELGERKQTVDDLLNLLLRRIDGRDGLGLEPCESRGFAARAAVRTPRRRAQRKRTRAGASTNDSCGSPRGAAAAAHFITGTVFCSEKPSGSTAPSLATALSARATNAASSRTAIPKFPAVSIKRE